MCSFQHLKAQCDIFFLVLSRSLSLTVIWHEFDAKMEINKNTFILSQKASLAYLLCSFAVARAESR